MPRKDTREMSIESLAVAEVAPVGEAQIVTEPMKPVVAEAGLIKVIPIMNFKCNHAGKFYYFEAEKEQLVPADLRRILREARKVYL